MYDADLPDFNLVVDVYADRVMVQEYAAPAEIDPGKTSRRLEEALAAIGAELQTPAERIVLSSAGASGAPRSTSAGRRTRSSRSMRTASPTP